jgi:hypothetical protein
MPSKNIQEETKNTLDLIKQGLDNPIPWTITNTVDNTRVNNINYQLALIGKPSLPPNPDKTTNFGKITTNIPSGAKALLDTIAVPEGTAGNSKEYDILVGGKIFTGWTPTYNGNHPGNSLFIPGIGNTSAAGRYQFLKNTWGEYGTKNGLTFGKNGQDTAGYYLLNKKRHISDILMNQAYQTAKTKKQVEGNEAFLQILDIISYEWASIPNRDGKTRYSNQPPRYTTQEIYDYYLTAVKFY